MRTPLRNIVLGTVAVTFALAGAGCADDRTSVPATAPTATGSAAPGASVGVSSIADRCRQAVKSLNTYASVAGQHPINILPGATNPPEVIEPVKQASAQSATELRAIATGITDEAVLKQVQESIRVLDASAEGNFGGDDFLPVSDLIKACGEAAPELADGEGLDFELSNE